MRLSEIQPEVQMQIEVDMCYDHLQNDNHRSSIIMNGITKADWKLFMDKVPEWQEAYMERLLKEYVKMLQNKKPAALVFAFSI